MFCFPRKSNQIADFPSVYELYCTTGAPLVNYPRHELANAEELEAIQRCVEHAMSELDMARRRASNLMRWAPVVINPGSSYCDDALKLYKKMLVARRKNAELDAFFQLQTMLSNEKVIVDRLVIDMVCKLAREKVEAVAADELQLAAVDEVAWQVEAARVQAELKKENAALAEKMSKALHGFNLLSEQSLCH